MHSHNIKLLIFLLCTVFGKANSATLNVINYGAVPNDSKEDTQAFQKCANLLKGKGGTIIIPAGNYLITGVNFLGKEYSNITIKGENATLTQIFRNKQRKSVHNNQYQTFAQRLSADAMLVFDAEVYNQKNDNLSIKNIKISGLNFKSNVVKYGFDELLHQVSCAGVSGFTVENCTFTGFLGDGIAITPGTDIQTFSYNKNITIRKCRFDGVNNDNRQGISIYYADGFLVEDCSFKNITRPGMPGAIDVEPGRNNLINRNGIIRNCDFKNIGGIASICLVLPESVAENDFSNKNFLVENCRFEDINSALAVIGNQKQYDRTQKGEDPDIIFRNSTVKNVKIAVELHTAYNLLIQNVTFENILTTTNNVLNDGGKNISFDNCKFLNINHDNGIGFYGPGENISFTNSIFENFQSYAVTFFSPEAVGKIENNTFRNSMKNGFAIQLAGKMQKNALGKIRNNVFQKTAGVN